jgi:hypothetical protein
VGANVTRLAWVFALPVLAAYARPHLRTLVAAATAAALLPALDLAGQLDAAADDSAQASFYAPLVAALTKDAMARPHSRGQRVEVLDPRNHWASAYLPPRFALARGWERQVDRSENSLFYRPGSLTSATYHRWLVNLAVGWVAVPDGSLDYASVREARLVASHPAYLQEIWHSATWRLYRVTDAPPLARPGRVVAVDDRAITLDIGPVTTVRLAVRWSPYLVVEDRTGQRRGCVGRNGRWTSLQVAAPGRYVVSADFDGSIRQGPQSCPVRPAAPLRRPPRDGGHRPLVQ